MTKWLETPLGEVADLINGDRGRNYPSAKDRVSVGIPFVNAGHLVGGRVRLDDMDYITTERFNQLRSGHVDVGDVLLCIRGSIGRAAIATADVVPGAIASSLVIVRPRAAIVPRFLLAFLQGPDGSRLIASSDNGVAQPNIGARDVARFTVPLPPLDIQRRIGAVLGALDDLIEDNRRRVEVLEEMAQASYREWFVRFRYPGHEGATFVDSPLGAIPEGWEVRHLREVAMIVRGRSYRRSELVDTGGVPFVNLKCLKRGGGFRRDGLKRYEGRHTLDQRVGPGDIVLAVTDLTQGREILARATLVPRLGEAFGVISLDVVRVVPHDPGDRLALLLILGSSDYPDRVKELANGSTVLHLSPDHVAEGLIVWPDPQLRRRFVGAVEPILAAVNELSDAADGLAALRDRLLPRLVTGKVDVSDLDMDALEASVA